MDKPITTRINVSTSREQAEGILTDYKDLNFLYEKAKVRNPNLVFIIATQRRFHPAHRRIREWITEIHQKTGCPVTSIQSTHCDGQWRFPSEIIDQDYHPYNQGYGKCSHSGYHFFDIITWYMATAADPAKVPDAVEIFTSFERPRDFLAQLPLDHYVNLFGEGFLGVNKYDREELEERMEGMGELSAFTNLSFFRGDRKITSVTLNLIHNGFAGRNWIYPGADLYKGNGRIRHEYYNIEMGPFACIQLHSYQGMDMIQGKTGSDLGQGKHLELYIFRNTGVLKDKKSLERLKLEDLQGFENDDSRRQDHQEEARDACFLEFLNSFKGNVTRDKLVSDFSSHEKAATIISGIYQSEVARLEGRSPVIKLPFSI